MTTPIRVLKSQRIKKRQEGRRPAHWVNNEALHSRIHGLVGGNTIGAINSTYDLDCQELSHSYRSSELQIVFQHSKRCPTAPDNISSLIPARKPTWDFDGEDAHKVKATWMGHASFFVELPARASVKGQVLSTARGARILFDPIFSERCSPIEWAGFKRITPPACSFEELPEVDVVVISHDHYDHQHNVGRNFMDRFHYSKSLWASFVAQEVLPSDSPVEAKSVFFAGDTGYRAVLDGQDEDKVPICEAFKEIGERFGPIDFAMVPIGAYMPRRYMSPIHCSPQDSVLLFKDIKAKRGVGMHWGTFVLTTEPIMDPPVKLKEACEKSGVKDGDFICTDIGQTMIY
ncbi:hypothetical protein BDZ97DRAFT_1923920 [Flammula alnicola]|nr:hypothetical protein BDZ97DRAFT_1923920 [Flammula alnicola]